MHKVIQLISIFLYNKNMPPSMKVHVHWMNVMKNQIIQKCQNLEILKERVAKQKTHFFNHLTKNYVQWAQYDQLQVQITCARNNLAKKHLWLLIETQFGTFSGIFCIFGYKPEYLYTIMYECENSLVSHELSKIGLIKLSHLNVFQVSVICKEQPHKSLGIFFRFLVP